MTFLPPGTFRVSDYRKPIPERIKRKVYARDFDVDHDPALCFRPYDTVVGDFIPPQHDLKHLVALKKDKHKEKTTGRKAGAAKTVTTRDSDVGEASRTRDIRATEAIHKATVASRVGDYTAAAEILSTVKPPRQKRPWPKRPFQRTRGASRTRTPVET